MMYGLHLSASGVLANMHRQDVIANNLANAHTTGFKRSLVAFRQHDPESARSGAAESSHDLLDRLGGTLALQPSRIDVNDGSLTGTGNMFDAALRGKGFFTVQVQNPNGESETQLTRDGHFALSTQGELVMRNTGSRVLDDAGQPITLDANQQFSIDTSGTIRQNGQLVARLGIANVDAPDQLEHAGKGLYTGDPRLMATLRPAQAQVRHRYEETSNVDPVREMLKMQSATGGVSRNGNMIRYQDQLLQRAITQLGRIS